MKKKKKQDGRRKEIQQESRGFEDEGLRTRKRKVERVKPERKFTAKSHWQEPAVEPRQNLFVGGGKRGKNSRERPLSIKILRRREEQ